MNNQFDAKKIPKFIYLLIGTIIALVLFSIFVLTPLINNSGAMKQKHITNQQLIRDYDNALALEDKIEAEIKKNQNDCKNKEEEIFVNLDKSSKLIEAYCSSNNIKLKTYTIADPKEDQMGRVSTGGYPVYTVNISISYVDTYEKTMSLLKYLENPENGCFYVKNCTLSQEAESKTNDSYDTSISLELYYYDRTVEIEAPTQATEATKK